MTFRQKLEKIVDKNNSLLCVGLDPELEKLPKHLLRKKYPILEFNKQIIDATHDLVCAYKPNIAFYEAEGVWGLQQLKQTIEYVRDKYPKIPIILDAKRADIGNTARMYARSAFEYWQADAVTVYPYLGKDAILPFLKYQNKLTILLLKTSNPDSGIFQNVITSGKPYYLYLAKTIKNWNISNIGLFIGATYPKEMQLVRKLFPEKIILSAGLGVQGADMEKAVKAGINRLKRGIMFNASRTILYAGDGNDFSGKTREEARSIKEKINAYR